MVEVRVEKREVCFRIAFLGPSGATKFANIRRLHDAVQDRGPEDLTVIHAGGDRIVGFKLFDAREEPLDDLRVGFECVTIPGEPRSPATERLLAASADSIVWLDDRESEDELAPKGLQSALEAMDRDLEATGDDPWPRPVVVQCYADDDTERSTLYREALGEREGRIRRIASDEEGLVSIFDEARERVIEIFKEESSRAAGKGRRRRRSKRARASSPEVDLVERRARAQQDSNGSLLRRFIGLQAEAAAGRAALKRAEFALLGALISLGLAGIALLVSLWV